MAKSNSVIREVFDAAQACESKKAEDVAVLELDKAAGAFTDYFVVCSGANPRQIQAISDEVEQRLRKAGARPTHVEGYQQAEWVLLDYVDFVVHVFSRRARAFYNLERLWKSAKFLKPDELRDRAARRRRAKGKLEATTASRQVRKPRASSSARKRSKPDSAGS